MNARTRHLPVSTHMGNGVTMTRSIVTGFTDPLEAIRTYSYAGTALAAYSPTYDPVYNKTVIAELDNVTTFTYDPARQLIGEVRSGSYPYNTTYLYDSMGNRIRKYDTTGITTNTYNPANQLLVSVPPSGPPTTSSYDNNGNLILQNTGGQLTTYTWDQENRLISVAVPSTGLTTYVYSDDGHRQATITGAGTTNFIYDGDIMLQEISPSGTVTQYAQGPGTWGLLLARTSGGTTDYYGPDDQHNVRLYLNTAGGVTGAYYTDAFGNIVSAPSVPNNFIWSGNVGAYAEILNYYRLLHRLVDSLTGRFINDDPLDFDGGSPNLRTYAGNNPVRWTDPSGDIQIGYAGNNLSHGRSGAPQGAQLGPQNCTIPSDKGSHYTFAIACSANAVDRISASVTLPKYCTIDTANKYDYINFYVSMEGGWEGGVSFSDFYKGWDAFFNDHDVPHPKLMKVGPGQTVELSLTRNSTTGEVVFEINKIKLVSSNKMSSPKQGKLVNAGAWDSAAHPPTHSVVSWSVNSLQGGLQAVAVARGGEQIVSNRFSSKLGNPCNTPCEDSMFD